MEAILLAWFAANALLALFMIVASATGGRPTKPARERERWEDGLVLSMREPRARGARVRSDARLDECTGRFAHRAPPQRREAEKAHAGTRLHRRPEA